MPQATVFVGSSSEGRDYAEHVAAILKRAGMRCLPWWEQFPVGRSFLEALIEATQKADAAIFIARGDDIIQIRDETWDAPRANVILEYGMFLGVLGRSRVALLCVGQVLLPNDLLGITQIKVSQKTQEQNAVQYEEDIVEPHLRPWIRDLKGHCVDGDGIRYEIAEALRGLDLRSKLRVVGEARWLRTDSKKIERYEEMDTLDVVIRKCAVLEAGEVGTEVRTRLRRRLDLRRLEPGSEEFRMLACNISHRIREVCGKAKFRFHKIAAADSESEELARAVADVLNYPFVRVDIASGGRDFVEGMTAPGERAVIVHDVIVSGHTPAQCASILRGRETEVRHVFAVAHYQVSRRSPQKFLRMNDLALHVLHSLNAQRIEEAVAAER